MILVTLPSVRLLLSLCFRYGHVTSPKDGMFCQRRPIAHLQGYLFLLDLHIYTPSFPSPTLLLRFSIPET